MRQSVLKLFLIAAVAGLSFVKNGFCQDLGDITDLVESTITSAIKCCSK
jgi:hypothetical protein